MSATLQQDTYSLRTFSLKPLVISQKLEASRDQKIFGLAKRHGIAPLSLYADSVIGVRKIGDHPIGGGGFADVWKGRIERENAGAIDVALKIPRSTSAWMESVNDKEKKAMVCH